MLSEPQWWGREGGGGLIIIREGEIESNLKSQQNQQID
jgi:hypothetical protein